MKALGMAGNCQSIRDAGRLSTLGSLFQLLLYVTQELIHFFSSFFVELRLVGGKMVQEPHEFAGMDPLFVGNVLQYCDRELVVSGLGELHIHLHRLVLCGHHETNGTYQFLLGQFAFIGETRKWCSKTWHTVLLREDVLRKECTSVFGQSQSHSIRRQQRANQAFAGSTPENGAILITTSTSSSAAVLRTLPEILTSASETRGCCSARASRRSLTL